MRRDLALEKLISPLVNSMGYSFEGLERLSQGSAPLIRLYIDKPGGVTIDDCEMASKRISAMLEVDSPLGGEAILEVSSPGLDRLLFTLPQFQAQIGKELSIRLQAPREGRRNFKGILRKVTEESLTLFVSDPKGSEWTFELDSILEARLVPKWS
jgi:ribosome maturation factor RimP